MPSGRWQLVFEGTNIGIKVIQWYREYKTSEARKRKRAIEELEYATGKKIRPLPPYLQGLKGSSGGGTLPLPQHLHGHSEILQQERIIERLEKFQLRHKLG